MPQQAAQIGEASYAELAGSALPRQRAAAITFDRAYRASHDTAFSALRA